MKGPGGVSRMGPDLKAGLPRQEEVKRREAERRREEEKFVSHNQRSTVQLVQLQCLTASQSWGGQHVIMKKTHQHQASCLLQVALLPDLTAMLPDTSGPEPTLDVGVLPTCQLKDLQNAVSS